MKNFIELAADEVAAKVRAGWEFRRALYDVCNRRGSNIGTVQKELARRSAISRSSGSAPKTTKTQRRKPQ